VSISKSVFFALLSSFLLVLLAGSAFSGFQNWVKLQGEAPKTNEYQLVTASGIRSISSVSQPDVQQSMDESSIVKKQTASMVSTEPSRSSSLKAPLIDTSNDRISTNSNPNRPVSELNDSVVRSQLEPSLVLYPNELVVEFPQAVASDSQIKQALARLLLSPDPFQESLLSGQSLSFKKRPYFFKQILDQQGQPIRYPAKAFAYIDSLMQSEAYQVMNDSEGRFVAVHVPLVKPDYPKPVARYKDWVDNYASEFSVSPALVFAIMETESGFKADAVSRSNAMGLMQLKAAAAGKDVFQYVDLKPGQPTHRQLFDEQENIRMGTAYLGLLNHDYLATIRNDRNKELLAIASYNGGLSTVLKLFGSSNEKALEQINRLHPRQVYRKLRFEHQSKETREYLDKVLKAKNRYQDIFNT